MSEFSAWAEKNRTLWTRVYDEVVTPQLEQEWKKRDDEHKRELKEKDETISDEVAKRERLNNEITGLRLQLEAPEIDTSPSTPQQIIKARDSTASSNDYQHLTEKYNELSKKYQDVTQKLKYLEKKNTKVMQQNKEMKESVRRWQEYCDRRFKKQTLKTEPEEDDGQIKTPILSEAVDPPFSPKSAGSARTPQQVHASEHSSPTPTAPLPHPVGITKEQCASKKTIQFGDSAFDASATSTREPNVMEQALPTSLDYRCTTIIPSSSQATEDETAEQNPAAVWKDKIEDDDDIPEFVSERSLKRKRDTARPIDIYKDRSFTGTQRQPIQIKEEQRSSPPANMHPSQPKETFDLDEPGPGVLSTPHRRSKRRKSIHVGVRTLQRQRSSSATFSQRIKLENVSADDEVTFDSNILLQADEQNSIINETRALSVPLGTTFNTVDVLQPLDPNQLPLQNQESSSKRLHRSELRRQRKHEILAESGEALPESKMRLSPNLTRAQFNRKLKATKNTPTRTPTSDSGLVKVEQLPTPQSTTDNLNCTPSGRPRTRRRLSNAPAEPSSDLTVDNRPIWRIQPSDTRSASKKASPSVSKTQVPLRSKSIHELNVQDFKPNPAYNQGFSYAFSETVRKRGDRLCLPGCTNAQCCGSAFRTLASAAPPLPASQEEQLLEDYLGDAYENMRLTQMASDEREELVLQARTRKMAKDSGKHRQAYEGRRTPPGYWRIDFPSTQEQKEDREKAKEQQRLVVQDRWMEAMRKGGRWVFRDE